MDYEYANLPLGLAMANLLDDDIRMQKGPLTEAEKEEMIFRHKDEQLKASFHHEDDGKDVFSGPGIG